jgi:two-component system, LytTR family, response regulator LytT
MKILIIEDEVLAYDRLCVMTKEIMPDAHIYQQVYSVRGSIDFLSKAHDVDLILMDIHLSDGNSFDIFKHITIDLPIIFVTAYDEYAVQAFKINSLDYLMKPVQIDELKAAFQKFDRYTISHEVLKQLAETEAKFPKNFNLKIGNKHFQVPVADICSIFSREKLSYVFTVDQKQYPIDLSLDKAMELLEPKNFFRANRHLIVQRSAIKGFTTREKSKLLITLNPAPPAETNVSSEKSSEFKEWWKA